VGGTGGTRGTRGVHEMAQSGWSVWSVWSGYLAERLFHVKQEGRQGRGPTSLQSSCPSLHPWDQGRGVKVLALGYLKDIRGMNGRCVKPTSLRETNIYLGMGGNSVLLAANAVYLRVSFYATKIQGP